MKPLYQLTPEILALVKSISEKIGQTQALYLTRPSPQLRRQNRIKTIHASLQIEGNALSEEQVTAILENKRVVGSAKDIVEVQNAIKAYDRLREFKGDNQQDFLKAHAILMKQLIDVPGQYRRKAIGIVRGNKIEHVAPPARNIPALMKDLFLFLKDKTELTLIKSAVFHYELEFIHPFEDGNGRIGRLWHTLILMQEYPVFEFIPLETMIRQKQKLYYKALAQSDKVGNSTPFVLFMLDIIDKSLAELLSSRHQVMSESERLDYFTQYGPDQFGRKEYLQMFKDISTATASRDLKRGIELKIFDKTGEKNQTLYVKRNSVIGKQ